MTMLWIGLAILLVVVLWIVGTFNGLIVLRTRVEEAWSDIEVQLKRRYDLIPNLISTVQGYATHEKEVFEKVTAARTQAISATGVADKTAAENMLSQTLKSLFAVAEAYPNLRANENFLSLQKDLTDTEDKIQYARRFYNGNVRDFNIKLHTFPSNVIAGLFKFEKREMFEVGQAAEREVPKVKF